MPLVYSYIRINVILICCDSQHRTAYAPTSLSLVGLETLFLLRIAGADHFALAVGEKAGDGEFLVQPTLRSIRLITEDSTDAADGPIL